MNVKAASTTIFRRFGNRPASNENQAISHEETEGGTQAGIQDGRDAVGMGGSERRTRPQQPNHAEDTAVTNGP